MPATAANGVLAKQPKTGQSLARVENFAGETGDRVHVPARLRGDPTEVLQEIQGAAFSGENGPDGTTYRGQAHAGFHGHAVVHEGLELDVTIDRFKQHGRSRETGEDSDCARDKDCLAVPVIRDDSLCREVAGADILFQGQLHQSTAGGVFGICEHRVFLWPWLLVLERRGRLDSALRRSGESSWKLTKEFDGVAE
jgi:hypothetical protein